MDDDYKRFIARLNREESRRRRWLAFKRKLKHLIF